MSLFSWFISINLLLLLEKLGRNHSIKLLAALATIDIVKKFPVICWFAIVILLLDHFLFINTTLIILVKSMKYFFFINSNYLGLILYFIDNSLYWTLFYIDCVYKRNNIMWIEYLILVLSVIYEYRMEPINAYLCFS